MFFFFLLRFRMTNCCSHKNYHSSCITTNSNRHNRSNSCSNLSVGILRISSSFLETTHIPLSRKEHWSQRIWITTVFKECLLLLLHHGNVARLLINRIQGKSSRNSSSKLGQLRRNIANQINQPIKVINIALTAHSHKLCVLQIVLLSLILFVFTSDSSPEKQGNLGQSLNVSNPLGYQQSGDSSSSRKEMNSGKKLLGNSSQ